MSSDTLKLLEFGELLNLVGNYVHSPLGKSKLWELSPSPEDTVRARLRLVAEAREYLRGHNGSPSLSPGVLAGPTLPLSFTGFTDPSSILSRLAVEGACLEGAEITALLEMAERADDIRRALLAARQRFPHLARTAEQIADFHSFVRPLRGKILPSGELEDHASPGLERIRRQVEKQRVLILASLRHFLQTRAGQDQEEIITIRSDRYVVPVRVDRKGHVKGVVHGSSSSGQTVFVEPLETIDRNNDLVRLREEEQQEVHRILREMTAQLRERAAELAGAADCIGTLDLAFACGRFSLDYDCTIPAFCPAGGPARLVLKEARHPLLEALLRKRGVAVVPVSLALEGEDRVLVISGPNTGGKTVALKTVGLLALMAMSGLPVPAAEAEFPLFDRILADIGDYQSIQESLSTFSAHLLNISSMIRSATGDSLILLDELGTATDQEEGGALGVAVVDRFRVLEAFTLATTHHMALKAYAMNTAGVRSASVGFDEQTLEPTYHLEVGWPGKSSGLAIAQRLGLPTEVLDHARQALSSAHQQIEQFIARLRSEQSRLFAQGAELERRLEEVDQREKQWMEETRRREAERAAQWEQQLEALWTSLEQRAEQKLRDLGTQSPKPARAAHPAIEASRFAARQRQQAKEELRQTLVSHLGGANEAPVPAPKEPEAGDTVRLKSIGRSGIVRAKIGQWLEVEIGHLRMKVPVEDVAEVSPASEQSVRAPRVSVHIEKANAGSLSEINVIGETAEEALSRVDKFLDNAFLAQVLRVRVVHGMGKGILRKALAEMFAEHPHVEKFSQAPQEEGGAGATIVELKV